MTPNAIVEWARIAAAMSNRFKLPLTTAERTDDEDDHVAELPEEHDVSNA
jgi:hypothetical protein